MIEKFRKTLFPVLTTFVFVYLIYHIFQGDRGVISYMRLTRSLSREQTNLASLERQRQNLENEVRLLKPDYLDLDLLAEKAHEIFGMYADNEVRITLPNERT